jgi:hypothetical protein
MLSITEFNYENCSCGEPMEAGVEIFGEGIGYPTVGEIGVKKFEQLNAYTIGFIPQGNLFTVYGDEGLQTIYYDNGLHSFDILPEVQGLAPYPSPSGDYWAWASPTRTGLWITENNSARLNCLPCLAAFHYGVRMDKRSTFLNTIGYSQPAPQFDTGTLVVEISAGEIFGLVN